MWIAIYGVAGFNSGQLTRGSEDRVESDCCRCVSDAESMKEVWVVHQLYMTS
jgi:hypothetical protein